MVSLKCPVCLLLGDGGVPLMKMYFTNPSRLLGLVMAILVAFSSAMIIPESNDTIQARAAPSDSSQTDLAHRYSIPKISVHDDHPYALSPRTFRRVPGLPDGWKAIFATTTTLVPIALSSKQLKRFYLEIALSAANLDDRWRWTIQCGQLALQFTSRNRGEPRVTKHLVLATVLMLNDFAKAGFSDLFVATLWHEMDGLAVDIQLMVSGVSVDTIKAT